ncbi:hypothetical protein FJTKL_01705 [Diaporthe vaccinii]|uniref:Extradiol ring-cleavage dioxygenase class III enzyme subunit B domain-containing protein n=1 Tax=Diaporthe vaccinii TaxID=105482 RepID=A0ABR4DZN7_9PEZI
MRLYLIFSLLVAALSFPLLRTVKSWTSVTWKTKPRHLANSQVSATMAEPSPLQHEKTPVYFLGIGGPNFMENRQHRAFHKLGEIGREITTEVKPKAVVVFSAHWQDGPSRVSVNVAEDADITYDFYNFPPHYYEYKYPNRGSPEIAQKAIDNLEGAGIEVQRVKRGPDHGVWVGFIAAFDPENNPLNVPIVQVSLFGNEDPAKRYRLGQAVETLRDEGILIVGAGMAVHNIQDYRATRGTGRTMPYASNFEEALAEAVATKPEERQAKMTSLLGTSVATKAHPSAEHILPMYIAAGAAGSDIGERIWALPEGSLNCGQYRFGKTGV